MNKEKREIYYKDVPILLRIIGCWGIEGKLFRFNWGEFLWGFGFGFDYSVYHEEATFRIEPFIFSLYLKMPMIINQRPNTEDWNASYGISYCQRSIHFNWRDKCKIMHFPFDWEHVRHSYYWPDGRLHHHAKRFEYEVPKETCESHNFTYVLKNGTVQKRIATINGEEREWRWKLLKMFKYPRKIQRTINIEFNGEVGERSGTWKGGTIGCGYEWKHGETMLQALLRMEKERKF